MRVNRHRTAAGLVLAAALAAPTVAPAQAGPRITPQSFGIHSFSSAPQVPAGSIRIPCAPGWRQIQPSRGTFRWAAMDAAIGRAESWGFRDLTFAFCGTPRWAGQWVADPGAEIFGAGSTAAPRRIADWRRFVTAVVRRYAGRIDHYQAWNEMTSAQFFQGSPARLARMTAVLYRVVHRHGRGANVLAASVQTHRRDWFAARGRPYFSALRARGWPVDVVTGHFYPAGRGGPNQRLAQIRGFRAELRRAQTPRRVAIWDTEANYLTSVPGANPAGRVRGARAATYVARTYLDSWRSGVRRGYWYLWADRYQPFPGVQLRANDPATTAYRTLAAWTVGSRLRSCRQRGELVRCRFTGRGSPFLIAFTTSGAARIRVPSTRTHCSVTGAPCRAVRGSVRISTVPARLS